MEKYDSWKRTEEVEIDLMHLVRSLCMQWKQIFVCACMFAVLTGGYGYLRDKRAADNSMADTAAEAELTLTEDQLEAVAEAQQLEAETEGLKKYLDQSALMQADPYHKNRVILLYSIDHARRNQLQKITESYLLFLTSGGAARAIQEADKQTWDMDISCLSELIAAYQKTYSFPYQLLVEPDAEEEMQTEALLYIEVTGKDAKMAKQLSEDLKQVLEKQSPQVQKTAGHHQLALLSCETGICADSSLLSLQHEKRELLRTYRSSLKAMTDAFDSGQEAVYKKSLKVSGTNKNRADLESSGIRIRYILLGLLCGAFVWCGIYACRYLLKDTIKSVEEMRARYTFPVFGCIRLDKDTQRHQDAAMQRIGLACKKQGIKKLCIVSDFNLRQQEQACMERFIKQSGSGELLIRLAENGVSDAEKWDMLLESEHVLLLCRLDQTTRHSMDEEMRFFMENGINVTGALALDGGKV